MSDQTANNFWAKIEKHFPEAGAAWDRDNGRLEISNYTGAFLSEDNKILFVMCTRMKRHAFSNLIPYWFCIDGREEYCGDYTESGSIFVTVHPWRDKRARRKLIRKDNLES